MSLSPTPVAARSRPSTTVGAAFELIELRESTVFALAADDVGRGPYELADLLESAGGAATADQRGLDRPCDSLVTCPTVFSPAADARERAL